MLLFLVPPIIYVGVAGILGGLAAWKWRRRASWQVWEWVGGVGPLLVWGGLVLADDHGKTLSNLVAEPAGLAIVVAAISWCRVALAPLVGPERAATCGAVLSLGAAWLVWWAVPGLPE